MGFGSIVIEDPEALTEMILKAADTVGARLIVSRGWSKLGGSRPSNDRVLFIDDCPHEWLFKHVAAVVHHGGAGTAACGLRFARPTFVVPFFGEYVRRRIAFVEFNLLTSHSCAVSSFGAKWLVAQVQDQRVSGIKT